MPRCPPGVSELTDGGDDMFARVTTLEGGDPAKLEESIRFAQEQLLPRARQMGGWKGVISLADRSTGDGLLITLWELRRR